MNITQLLSKCFIFRAGTEILIICDTDETFIQLVRGKKRLIQTVTNKGEAWGQITLKSGEGEKQTIFYPPQPRNRMVHSTNNILVIPEAELISEILKFPNPSSLVRVEDDKGIFTNSHVQKSSGTTPNNWVGAKMSSYWIPEELERYKRLLLKEREITNFKYTAYFFTGETAQFTVNARLVNFNGDLCRWVQVVNCDVIS